MLKAPAVYLRGTMTHEKFYDDETRRERVDTTIAIVKKHGAMVRSKLYDACAVFMTGPQDVLDSIEAELKELFGVTLTYDSDDGVRHGTKTEYE